MDIKQINLGDTPPSPWHKVALERLHWRFYRLKRRLNKIVAYNKIALSDEDFDPFHLYKLMSYKLQAMREQIAYENRHTDVPETIAEIMEAERLLSRIITEPYLEELQHLCSCPEEIMKTDEKGFCTFHFCDYCKNEGFKLAQQNAESDWKTFWNHLSQNMRKWWS